MSTFQVIQQRPVMREQRLGSIPQNAYVQNQGNASAAPAFERLPGDLFEVSNGQDIKAMGPARNQDGTIQLTNENVTLNEDKHDSKKFALITGLSSAAAGAIAGVAGGGLWGAVAGAVLGGAAGGGLGYATAAQDEVSVLTREAAVTEPVLKGFYTAQSHGELPAGHHYGDSAGTYYAYVPQIEHKEVGKLQFHEVAHSKPGIFEVAGVGIGAGGILGALAGVTVRTLL